MFSFDLPHVFSLFVFFGFFLNLCVRLILSVSDVILTPPLTLSLTPQKNTPCSSGSRAHTPLLTHHPLPHPYVSLPDHWGWLIITMVPLGFGHLSTSVSRWDINTVREVELRSICTFCSVRPSFGGRGETPRGKAFPPPSVSHSFSHGLTWVGELWLNEIFCHVKQGSCEVLFLVSVMLSWDYCCANAPFWCQCQQITSKWASGHSTPSVVASWYHTHSERRQEITLILAPTILTELI